MSFLAEALIYLLAAVIAVPISRWLGFGSILGYLTAGIVIGPFGIALVGNPEDALHFGELGVVFLLFIVGLELKPSRLWVLRRMVFGLGASQVVLSAIAITLLAFVLGYTRNEAIVIGLIVALSSTAFVLQMLAEKKQLSAVHGRAAFTILLFQDLAAIPLIAIMPLLGANASLADGVDLIQIGIMAATIIGLIIAGRYLLRPALRIVAKSEIPEIFTASAILVVMGAALLMQYVGMSMVLGAFIAGMMLADSEYRHELEADLAPFKGLLLGLFFIAVGMSVNIGLFLEIPGRIVSMVLLLMFVKAAVLFPLARYFGMCDKRAALKTAAVLAQGGEFAFVLLAIAARQNVLPTPLVDELVLAVAVSMLLTPFFYAAAEKISDTMHDEEEMIFDMPKDEDHDIIIAGFGRVGQIIGRLLAVAGVPFTALDRDSSQVDVVRRYGSSVHYGDAKRHDLLHAAGARRARIFVLAISNIEESVRIAESVIHNYPHLTIIARARNRRHVHTLMDLGVKHIFRETLASSLAMSELVLQEFGQSEEEAHRTVEAFAAHDNELLIEQHAFYDSEEKLIQTIKDASVELGSLLSRDRND